MQWLSGSVLLEIKGSLVGAWIPKALSHCSIQEDIPTRLKIVDWDVKHQQIKTEIIIFITFHETALTNLSSHLNCKL